MKKLDGRSKAARALKATKQERYINPHSDVGRKILFNQNAGNTQVGGSHYMKMNIQPWDAMQSWMSQEEFVGMLRGNAIKYVARCNAKGGVEDIKKARHYLDKLIEVLEGV